MQPCLSIINGAGDVVLQHLMVLSVNGNRSTAAGSSTSRTYNKLRRSFISVAITGATYTRPSFRRRHPKYAMAQTADRRTAASIQRARTFHVNTASRSLGRSKTAIFETRNAIRCGPCPVKAGGSNSVRALLRASLCELPLRVGFVSSMDKRRSSYQIGHICIRSRS